MQLPASVQTRKAFNTSSIVLVYVQFFPQIPHSMWLRATLNKLHKNFHVDCTKQTEKNTNNAKKVVEDN